MSSDRLDDELAHAKLSPSSAEGWSTCLDYVFANEGLPDEDSEPAAEGTVAHGFSDACFSFGVDPYDFVGTTTEYKGFSFEWTEDDADLLYPGIERIRALPGTFYGEHRVSLLKWLGPDQFGTLDRGVVSDDLITISDLKWGRGVPVSPIRNKQLMLYALGFWWNVARHVSKATASTLTSRAARAAAVSGERPCPNCFSLASGSKNVPRWR
jgi:hypothetical protein